MSTTNPQRDNPALPQSIGATGSPLPSTGDSSLPDVFGRYRVIRQLGRGAMGAVFLAHDTQLSRQVAIKVPRFQNDDSGELLERFYLEARLAATLRNPYLCPVYDVGEIQGVHYISMAFIEGKSLAQLIRSAGPQKERASLLLLRKLAIALHEAHSAGIIHRDLKPANVMIDSRGEPVVMDFGLAFQPQEDQARLTHHGVILGSPAYMSPEQLKPGDGQLTPASDQFSLGVLLFELLTGQLPFQGAISAVANQIVNGPAPSPKALRPDLDSRTEKLCLRLLEKRAADRFDSMKAVADHIAAILKASSTASAPTGGASDGEPATDSCVPQSAPNRISLQQQVDKLLSWGELVSALETLENPGLKLQGSEADWIRKKRVEIRGQVEHWNQQLPAQSRLGRDLIAKHDYSEAVKILSLVPVGVRNDEISALLAEAQGKADEVDELLETIENVFRAGTAGELKRLVKRFLQLKPGHQRMKKLAEDLRRYGPEQVIQQRRRQRSFLDPAGKVWEPKNFALYGLGLSAACVLLYLATVAFQAPAGTVSIEILDPAISIDFASTTVSAADSGKTFKVKAGEKQMLAVRLGGDLVSDETREISVERNETKRIQARLVDGNVELTINSERRVFPVAPKDDGQEPPPPGSRTVPVAISPAPEWIDLLSSVDPEKAAGRLTTWERTDGVLIGKPKPGVELAWVSLTPTTEFIGDYDLEVDFLVEGTDYCSVAFPLNETTLGLSLAPAGGGFQWIDGQRFTAPESSPDAVLQPGRRQKLALSVRHNAENVSIKAVLDGRAVAEFSGLRSRLAIPKEALPVLNRLRIVTPISNPAPTSRIEVRQARIRRPTASAPALIAKTSTPTPPVAAQPDPVAAAGDFIINADFRKSAEGFNQADQDFASEQHQNGEFRYLGKKAGWWYAPFCHAFWVDENNQLREFAVEFDLRLANPNRGEFALEFGRIGDQACSLCFNHAGQVRILRGGDEIVAPATSTALKPVDQFNRVRMVVERNVARVSVNGMPLFEKTFDHLGARHLAAWLHVDEYPFDVRFQSFRIERLGESEPRQFDREIRRFEGHTGAIRGIAFLPDGRQAVSVANDHGFKLWNVETGELVHDFTGHTAPVTSVSLSSDGTRALTGCDDGVVRLWDLEARQLIKALEGHTAPVSSVLISKVGLIGYSASLDGSIRRWDLKSFAKPAVLPGPGGEATLIHSPDESLIAASAPNGAIVMKGSKAAGSIIGNDPAPVRGMAFTPDGKKLVSAGSISSVRVWDVADGRQIHAFQGDDCGFGSVAVTADGRHVVAGCRDFTIRCWNLETGDEVSLIRAPLPVTHRIALSSDNAFLLSGGGDGANRNDFALRLWPRLPTSIAK